MKNLKYFVAACMLFVSSVHPLLSQTVLEFDDKSTMSISGTSTLHNWHSEVETIKARVEVNIQNGKLLSFEKMLINVPVTSIKSGKNAMDKNTYEALKSDNHPLIKFQLTSAEITETNITAEGKLAVAGIVRNVTLKAQYVLSASTFTIKGDYEIDMNDYEIDPPTALMGTITTGKDVTVQYQIIFNF